MPPLPPALQQRAVEAAQPLTVYLELTYLCNWRCVFCYNPRHTDLRRLAAAEWIAVLDDLRQLGTMTVTLTGGEPMASPDFFAIAAAARDRKFVVNLYTNGSLIGPSEADEIRNLNFGVVDMSVHGCSPETHDRVTARPGSFNAVWRAVRLLRERNVRVQLKAPLTNANESEIDAMMALASEAGVPIRFDPRITARDDGDTSPLQYRASPASVRRVLSMATDFPATQHRVAGGVNCGLGRTTLAIDPEGNVYPCMQWRQSSVGNVRTVRLKDLWHSSPARKVIAQTAVDANSVLMEQNESLRSASFCPALAFERTGSPTKLDEDFLAVAMYGAELRSERQ